MYIHIYVYNTVSPRPKGTFCVDYRSQSLNAKPTFIGQVKVMGQGVGNSFYCSSGECPRG